MSTSTSRTDVGGLARGLEQLLVRWDFTPLQVAVLYYAFGFGALYLSDVLLVSYLSEPLLSRVQALKGAVEVLVTGGLVFVLARGSRAHPQRTTARLERQQEELTVLHRVLRHDLRNTLDVVRGYTTELEQRVDTDEARAMCERITRKSESLLYLADQTTRIRQIATANEARVTLDLADAIPALLEDHELVTDEVSVETTLPESAPVEVNHMFREALGEILTNAIVHNDTTRLELAVTVATDPAPPGLTEIAISDNGTGFPPLVQQVLDDGEHDQLVHLDGLGLWFVRLTVTDVHGDVLIDTNDPRGTTVRLWVPTAVTIPGNGLLAD